MKQKLSIALSLISVFLTLFLSFNLKTSYAVNDSYPVTICHATGSAENPYTTIHVNSNAIGGHFENPGTPKSGHEDDILFAGTVECPGPVQNTPFPTNPDFPECDNQECPTIVTPTFQPTPTPGGGNIDLPCLFERCVTPTVTPNPTSTPVATPTVAPTDSPRGGSNGDGGSSGGGSSSSSSSSSSTGGSVLGATTMAPTGTFLDTLFNGVATVGLLFLGLATIQYGKEKSL